MTDEKDSKSLIIFGRDVSKIPCFRNSYLYGISGGLGIGLLTFLFTSRPKRAADVGFGSFIVILFGYWAHCRYQFSKTRFEMLRVQELMRRHVAFEGTEMEREVDMKNQKGDV